MTTTLIVRDATLAINGAPEKRGEPRAHLAARVQEVARMDTRTAEECVEVLATVARGENPDPEALEALVLVGTAQPKLAERLSLQTVAMGRQLAAIMERDGQVERAMAVLELLQKHFPGQDSLERDLSLLMRRQGMVQDLVSRYFERAKTLAREGRPSEAAGWLREVLQLDPSRRDAARMMRDLRFKKTARTQSRGSWARFLFVATVLSLGSSYTILRELRLHEEYRTLEEPTTSPTAMKRRLAELEQFIQRNPVWHGAFQALSARSRLRVQLAVLEDNERQAREDAARAERERLEAADLYREQGLMYVNGGDVNASIEAFKKALATGGPSWPKYAQVSRDLSELEANQAKQP